MQSPIISDVNTSYVASHNKNYRNMFYGIYIYENLQDCFRMGMNKPIKWQTLLLIWEYYMILVTGLWQVLRFIVMRVHGVILGGVLNFIFMEKWQILGLLQDFSYRIEMFYFRIITESLKSFRNKYDIK